MKLKNRLFLCSLLLWALSSSSLLANNGSIAYLYPIADITIDGKLNDWPSGLTLHPLSNTHYGELSSPKDAEAFWRGGYDAASGHLYIAVTMQDDDYVKTPDDSHFATHDFQVLYIDPTHSWEGAGVIGYEIDEDHRKIIEQEGLHFYPQVKNASFDNIDLAINRKGKVVTYEWKIKIDGPLKAGRVIGFDYAAFDKDTDEGNVMLTWGRTEGNKFMNSNLVGDIVLLEQAEATGTVQGTLEWVGDVGKNWPNTIKFRSTDDPTVFIDASVDSTGQYRLALSTGNYAIIIPPSWQMNRWFDIDMVKSIGKLPSVTITGGEEHTVSKVPVTVARKPNRIPEEGILHTPFTTTTAEQVDNFVKDYQAYYNIPAVSLALIQDGKLVYHQSYGVENTISKQPLRDKAVFEAASITKLVFAYAMNKLVQRGEFDLEKPLSETLLFPALEEYPEYKQITGKHVLTHVSGLPNWGTRMINTPGTTFGYSGEGFEYLKRTLAGTDGDEMASIILSHLDKEILGPTGMKNTYFMCNDQLPNLKVAGHRNGIPNMFDCPEEPGMAYSMHTEAKDFAAFAIALLNREGLTEEQAADMFTFHTLEEEDSWMNGYKSGYGLGVALRESPHGLVFGHGGNNGDFRCVFEIYDELQDGYIMFTNANTAGPLLFDLRTFLVEGKKYEVGKD